MKVFGIIDFTYALATAAFAGLDHDWVADISGRLDGLIDSRYTRLLVEIIGHADYTLRLVPVYLQTYSTRQGG